MTTPAQNKLLRILKKGEIPLESFVQSAVLEYLTQAGYFVFRTNNGGVWDKNIGNSGGYRSPSKYSTIGLSDSIMLYKGTYIGIEFKRPKKKQDPDQIIHERRVKRNGGKYYVIHSLEEAKEMLSTLGIAHT